MKLELVGHAKFWSRMWSMRLGITSALLKGADSAYRSMHPDWASHLPHWLVGGLGWAALMTGAAATAAVVVKQNNLTEPAAPVTTPDAKPEGQ